MLYVTHDQAEAMTLATRIGVLDRGRLVQLGTPRDIYENPVSSYVATRLGNPAINLLPRSALPRLAAPECARRRSAYARSTCACARRKNGAALGRVRWIEHLGDQNHLHVTIGDQRLRDAHRSGGRARGRRSGRIDFVTPLFFDADGLRLPG